MGSVYDSRTLCHTYDLITKWILHIEASGEAFPSNFDFNFLFKGVAISLELDHCISISKVLSMLYRTMHFYPLENKNQIISEVLKKYFYKFFFHWSYNTREMLYLIVFY